MARDFNTKPIPAGRQNNPVEIIQYVFSMIVKEADPDLLCACGYHLDTDQLDIISFHSKDPALRPAPEDFQAIFREQLRTMKGDTPLYVSAKSLQGTGFKSAVLVPFAMPDQVMGMITLFSGRAKAFTPDLMDQISMSLSLIITVVENLYLSESLAQSLIISQSILLTAETIADNPTPQHIINVLSNYLFDTHVTSCAIMFYGPIHEDRPFGPFDYMEIKGSWTKQHGGGIALGTRLYLKDYLEYLDRLDQREVLVFNNAGAMRQFTKRMDPFMRSLVRAARIRSLTILPLHSGQRKLGIIVIGTEKSHEFTRQELGTYQAVSEFLAINAMSQIIQQQHDLVQQGRAALLDAVAEGILMVLPDAQGARVLTVNQRFTNLFGLSQQKAQGLLIQDLLKEMQLPKDVKDDLAQTWLSITIRDPLTQHGEFHMIHSEGYSADIEWYSAPVYQDSYVLGRIYIFQDVTVERTAVRARSAFLSRVSHELRTPLTSIHGFAEFILEVSGDALPDLAREYTNIILNSAKHLRNVFTDMIEMTRADSGELKLVKRDAHLPDLVIDTVAGMELQYKARQQNVVMDIDDDLPTVNVDTTRITQVLTNLLSNAIKYAPKESEIRITTHLLQTPEAIPTGHPDDLPLPSIMVSIDDQGQGIEPEDIDQIFTPFFRTKWARINQIEGSGLGLAVTRSIVELHRGRIWVRPSTKKDPGGHFAFCVPISSADSA